VSDLDPKRSMHIPVLVAHSSFIEGSYTTKNVASGFFKYLSQTYAAKQRVAGLMALIVMDLFTPKGASKHELFEQNTCHNLVLCHLANLLFCRLTQSSFLCRARSPIISMTGVSFIG